jgi:hypothetical protein
MRLVSDRVQFGVVTTVAVVGWLVVTFTTSAPGYGTETTLGSELRRPGLAMLTACLTYLTGWATFDWRTPPRRGVTLSCGVLALLYMLSPFLSSLPNYGFLVVGVSLFLLVVTAAVSVLLVSARSSEGQVESVRPILQLGATFGFVLFALFLQVVLTTSPDVGEIARRLGQGSSLLLSLGPLSALALFPLSWRHFPWTGTSSRAVVGGSMLLGAIVAGLLLFLVSVRTPFIRLFAIPFGFLAVTGLVVVVLAPEWIRRPEVVTSPEPEPDPEPVSESPAVDSASDAAPPPTDSSPRTPDSTPPDDAPGAPSDDPFAASSVAAATTGDDAGQTPEKPQAGSAGPPDRISRAPDLSIDYDALNGRDPLGRGGNADVYRASVRAGGHTHDVAVKEPRMSGTLHTDAVDRLLAEAETWDKLDDHDHVVGVVDYGADPLPWIAMEYMDAGDLTDRAGALPYEQACWTARVITEGVRHAHRRGVAHLDLKPANVLFRAAEGAWDVPKVADWGLSKHLLEHSQSVEGLSPHYAAPEQFDTDRGPADDVTDVYQLGAVLYELFTGRPPFEGDPTSVMHRVLHEDPAPPSAVSDVPPALDDVLLTALATEKRDRYDSVLYLRDEFRDRSTL